MMNKLESVKEKLEYTLSVLVCADVKGANASLQGAKDDVITALAELKEVMDRLNSERPEARFNAVVTQLLRVHDDESGKPQYSRYTHIECKDQEMRDHLQELARKLDINPN